MGSIQQIAMAAVCLAAAFAFGSFINQTPNQHSDQTVLESPDHLRSLIESDLPVKKSPAKTPWMKPRLSARLPMPSLSNDNLFPGQPTNSYGQQASNAGEIPPPSDLTGRIGISANNSTTAGLATPQPITVVANAPTFGSESLAESSMPTVNNPNFGSSPNLADSMRAPSQPVFDEPPLPPVEHAPVFAVAGAVDVDPLPKSRAFQPQPHIASKPPLPNHSMRPIEPTPTMATRPTTVIELEMPPEAAASSVRNPFARSFDGSNTREAQRRNVSLMPIPRIKPSVTITDPGGVFSNRNPQMAWDNNGNNSKTTFENDAAEYYPEANRQRPPQQRRVARLPLQLNSNAKSKLTRLRDNTIQKISLSTTQFSEHVVERGDSLQSIANNYFGKPDFYLDIYLANRDRLRYPGDIREGMTIKIPVYE